MMEKYPSALGDIEIRPPTLAPEHVWKYSEDAGGLDETDELRSPEIPTDVPMRTYATNMVAAVTELARTRRLTGLVDGAPRDKLIETYGDNVEDLIDRSKKAVPDVEARAHEAFFAASGVEHLLDSTNGLTPSERKLRKDTETAWKSFVKLTPDERKRLRAGLTKLLVQKSDDRAA